VFLIDSVLAATSIFSQKNEHYRLQSSNVNKSVTLLFLCMNANVFISYGIAFFGMHYSVYNCSEDTFLIFCRK